MAASLFSCAMRSDAVGSGRHGNNELGKEGDTLLLEKAHL